VWGGCVMLKKEREREERERERELIRVERAKGGD
jgi:hypothetical protein